MTDKIEEFINELTKSLSDESFVKLALGNYKGADEHLQKVSVRLVGLKKGTRLLFRYRFATRDVVENHDRGEAVDIVRTHLDSGFRSAHLFTTASDIQLTIGKKNSRVTRGKPTFSTMPDIGHDREKASQIAPDSFYLKALGITTDDGKIRDKQRDKWRQINKFVEILGGLFEKSRLSDRKSLNIVDMGSGKGYLTFAAYDHFANHRGIETRMTGVDTKREMVDLCAQIAKAGDFEGLNFVYGTIADYDPGEVDILIALHACDTATDDALYKGIAARAEIIIAAPCCHKEIRPQIKPPEMFSGILKHGIMLERTAETITDGLRSLLLERSGYATKLFEFVSTEHTPKNNMIVGTRTAKTQENIDEQIRSIKEFYGIKEQRLEQLLR